MKMSSSSSSRIFSNRLYARLARGVKVKKQWKRNDYSEEIKIVVGMHVI
jgi:hypothetical protein